MYSSIQTACSRRTDCFDFFKKCDETLSFDVWKKVERKFGNRFHVRGWSGVLEIAQQALEDRPFALFFLAVSMCFSERVPWETFIYQNSSNNILLLFFTKFNLGWQISKRVVFTANWNRGLAVLTSRQRSVSLLSEWFGRARNNFVEIG